MATLSYWEQRMEQLYNAQDKKNNALDKKLRKEYLRLEESIKKDIASYYQKYGTDNVIQYRQLVLSLSQSERDLLYKDMETFAKKYPQYANLMPVRESIYKLNRLEGLQLSIRMKMVELGAFEQEGFEKLLMKAYERGYLSTMKGLDNAPSFFSVNDIFLQQTLNQKWIDGGNFSSRIWTNKEKLINTLNNEIRDAIIRGDDYKQMSKIIQNRLGVGANDAYRLVVTESAFVMNQANKQAFMDAGIKKYQITAVMDRRTSPTCRSLNGETFEFANAKVGVNYPPFHPFCRTTVVPIENENNSISAEKNDIIKNEEWLNSTFSNEKKFKKHIEDHISEYGNITSDEYLEIARKLLAAPLSNDVEGFVDKDGYLFKYRKSTNDFAIGRPDGYISTLFKPILAYVYWLEQIEKFGREEDEDGK